MLMTVILLAEDDGPTKLAKAEIPSSVVPGSLGVQFTPQSTFGAMRPVYNPALPVPPAGWSVPPRPQQWFPPYPAASVPPAPLGMVQQPLFPVQNVRPPVPSSAPLVQPSFPIAPPGLSQAANVPVSQPLFPVVVNNNISAQSLPFSAPTLSTSIPLSSPLELKSSIDISNNFSAASGYHAPGIQVAVGGVFGWRQKSELSGNVGDNRQFPNSADKGATSVNSHSYASGPNTGGPSIGPPPVIANKAPVTQLGINEVYLVWDDEAMSMEERRMSLLKYQVHDETSQMSSIDAAIDKRISESRLAGRMTF
ncbi:zinc finger (C2H2 type) family protein [Actinidia rufa]|uniref:Zinc finger (C2H2 type) family protein n=1 Tax=Actinidia rufa TaxID=165716 RepID=A0A7J0DXG3_9ERIC|nr:zinc finger (C2H2 type) family protein [Actinidia rufa]